MKFARRRVFETAPDAQAPAPADVPPADRPVAAFAGVLDGRRLWVAVEVQPGTIGLRDTRSGDVVAPPDDADDDDQPGHLSARLHLTGLADDTTYDVVVVPPGNGSPLAVWTPPLTVQQPRRDGAHQHSLSRSGDGTLRLHRAPAPEAAELTAVSAAHGGVHLRITGAGTGTTVALVGGDGAAVATWTGERAGDDLVVLLTVAELGAADPQLTRVVVGDALLPVRRRADGLADPGRAAPLPQLDDGDSDRPRLRLRWSPQGVLQARIVEVEA